jgi:cytochrome c-type biogenesis protein CcmE
MKPKKRRFLYLSLITLFLGGVTLIVLTTLNDHLIFFMMPTDALLKKPTTAIRLGGLVEEGSLKHLGDHKITFRVTDGSESVLVIYRGIIPDLFREGQGVIAEGKLSSEQEFHATSILAKHDEKYMPKDVADALKANGTWRPEQYKNLAEKVP